MPNESSEIGSGFVKIFYSILITLVICAGIYIIADYLISDYFNESINLVLSDIMTKITLELSGFDSSRVIGSGTTLDTARLRFLLGNYFSIDPRNVHAYVIGEHGDSEIVPWSQAYITTKSVFDVIEHSNGKFKIEDLNNISKNVTGAAQEIIKAKSATYYGIGMALVRIVRAIFGDEKSALTCSVLLNGQYGINSVYAGLPAIIGRNGVEDIIVLDLKEDEEEAFINSCNFLKETAEQIGF